MMRAKNLPDPIDTGAFDWPLARSYVYRAYDAKDRLLYVGQTSHVESRMREHASSPALWPAATVRVEWERYASRELALRVEAHYIETLLPLHNTAWNGRRLALTASGHERFYSVEEWARLGLLLRERREKVLRVSRKRLASDARLPVELITAIENGWRSPERPVEAAAMDRLDHSLDLRPGSWVRAIVDGDLDPASVDELHARAVAAHRQLVH